MLLWCSHLLKEVWHPRRHQRAKENNNMEIIIMSVYDSGIALLGERSSFQEAFSLKKKKIWHSKKIGENSKMFVEIMKDMRP